VRIQLDHHIVLHTGIDDRLVIYRVTLPAKQ